MAYLSRPVFEFAVDWSAQPDAQIDYDLQEISLGFGVDAFVGDQTDSVHGWSFDVRLDSEDSVAAWDAFFDAVAGRLVGFWLPTPTEAFAITANVSSSALKVAACGLADWWNDRAELHVWLTKSGQTSIPAKVSGVVDNGDGTETVTFSTSVVGSVNSTWRAQRLEYVRLAGDREDIEFSAAHRATARCSVVELPREYATYETGQKFCWFYRFWTEDGGARVDWYFTSYRSDLTVPNSDESPVDVIHTAKRITHGQMTRNASGRRESLSISAEFESENPLYRLIPNALAMPLYVEVRSALYTDLTALTVLFVGRVMRPAIRGKVISVECVSLRDVAGAAVPGFFLQPRCNYRLFEPNTCRVNRVSFFKAATVISISGTSMVVESATLDGLAANWFAEGFIEIGTNESFERRTIISSTATDGLHRVTLTLNYVLANAAPGNSVTLLPGCNGTKTTCTDKFSNLINFGGHTSTRNNLALQAIEVPPSSAGKK